MVLLVLVGCIATPSQANPDAKRLYDDLLSNYNRLIRPVSNNTDTVLVKLGLRLSQLIDLVAALRRADYSPNESYRLWIDHETEEETKAQQRLWSH
ncbi:hypothetical protein B7P43_G08962 [Cryptotermes secundus]|uniref:Neurotransmitter-gated ion-channel ligand-binding domain-containing protein n=1 Tax=Cryptotermes secundus TaxID=105785 RepID=A0A2J7PS98_9NEOP|nr:hypothetical protein B7P43_G08962 [Cryptotermes secundus]